MAVSQSLRRKAKAAGMPIAKVRTASRAELESFIAEANGKPRKAVAKKAVRKATVKKATAQKASKRAPAAKSTTGKAKRPATRKATASTDGRHLLGSVDFNDTDGWNARLGSAPDRIIMALKKARGNREKAFEALKGDVWDFVGKVKRNSDKRTKAEAYSMLRYRISRTLWDFATKTGQHDRATNRIEYGTGENATTATKKKLAKSRAKAQPKAKVTTGRKRGRPKGSKNKK